MKYSTNLSSLLKLTVLVLLIQFCSCQSADCGDKPAVRGPITFKFPDDCSLGRLFAARFDSESNKLIVDRQAFSEARGAVRIPVGMHLKLKLSFDGARRASDFQKLDPEPFVSLDARGLDNLTDDSLQSLGHLTNVRSLTIDETDISDEGFWHLTGMKKLAHLSMSRTLISTTSLAAMKSFPVLTNLSVAYNRFGNAGLAAMPVLPELEIFDAKSCALSDEGVKSLSRQPKLTAVDLSRNEKLTDGSMVAINNIKSLRFLEVFRTGITTQGLQLLKNHNMRKIGFNRAKCSPHDFSDLQKMFPGCLFDCGPTTKASPDLFTPLR